MNRDFDRPISRQALGRTAFLGSLYDATTDEFCERTIINDDIPAVAIRHVDENHGHSSYEFDTSQSKKLRKLNVDVSLSLSVMGGLVKSAGATGSYIYARDTTSQTVEATFIHRSIIRTEALNVSHKELKSRIEPTALRHKNATHVVTSIRWGADVFAHFEAKSTSAESKHNAKVGLKLELNKLLSQFVSINPNNTTEVAKDTAKATTPPTAPASTTTTTTPATTPANTTTTTTTPASSTTAQVENGSAGPQLSYESTSNATTFTYKITLFGDLIPTTCPKSIDELTAMLPNFAADLHKTNGGKGRPLEYIMLPLTELAEILGQDLTVDRIFRAVEENTAHEIQTIFDEADQLRTTAHTLNTSIQYVEEFFRDEEINKVAAHQRTISRMERDIRSRIGKMLVQVRSGNTEPSELDQLLVELESQVAIQKIQTKQLERGDINEKIEFARELKEKNVLAIREPEKLAIIQNRHPKHKLIVLYLSDELRLNAKDKWITVYFEFIRRIEYNLTVNGRVLFYCFDFGLNPNFQSQQKKLEVREYVGAPVVIPTAHIRSENINGLGSVAGIDSLFRNMNAAADEYKVPWHKDSRTRFDEIFSKTNSRILVPYASSLATRNVVFDKLRGNQKNILIFGRSYIGKSTFKSTLVDPGRFPDSLKPYSQTEFPIFEQYSVSGTDVILNFIDTPGLFQQAQSSSSLPDNITLMQLIDGYIRSKVTQLHFVCFCVSIETNINTDDLHAIKTFFDFLGPEIRKNACLIITKCESKDEQQRENIYNEAQNNLDFKVLTTQMKQGIFFTGSLNKDDWIGKSNTVYKQFETICEYRNKLINLFINTEIKPFDLTSNNILKKIKDQINLREKNEVNQS